MSDTTAETNEVVAKEEALPAIFDDLDDSAGDGFEDTDKDSYAIPFLRILQAGSPQISEEEPSYITDAKPGMFFNTVTNELYGRILRVIPIHYARDFIEWLPNRGGFVKAHGPNPEILQRVEHVDENNNDILDNGNIIQDTRNHIVLLADSPGDGPIIFSLSSTGIKHSRKWMTLMRSLRLPGTTRNAPMYAGIWQIETIRNENDEGKWYQIGDKSVTCVKFDGWVNKKQLGSSQASRELIKSGSAKADWDSTVDKPSDITSDYDSSYQAPPPGHAPPQTEDDSHTPF